MRLHPDEVRHTFGRSAEMLASLNWKPEFKAARLSDLMLFRARLDHYSKKLERQYKAAFLGDYRRHYRYLNSAGVPVQISSRHYSTAAATKMFNVTGEVGSHIKHELGFYNLLDKQAGPAAPDRLHVHIHGAARPRDVLRDLRKSPGTLRKEFPRHTTISNEIFSHNVTTSVTKFIEPAWAVTDVTVDNAIGAYRDAVQLLAETFMHDGFEAHSPHQWGKGWRKSGSEKHTIITELLDINVWYGNTLEWYCRLLAQSICEDHGFPYEAHLRTEDTVSKDLGDGMMLVMGPSVTLSLNPANLNFDAVNVLQGQGVISVAPPVMRVRMYHDSSPPPQFVAILQERLATIPA